MITGLPPFQSQSAYLIFQKIQTLEYSFHEGFDARAKDLVTKFLVIDPIERLGAQDTVGYPSIKSHPFFANIDFDSLHISTPPQIQTYIGDPDKIDAIWEKNASMQPGLGPTEMSRILKMQIEDGSYEESDTEIGTEDLDPDDVSIFKILDISVGPKPGCILAFFSQIASILSGSPM